MIKPINLYVATVCLGAAGGLLLVDWSLLGSMSAGHYSGLAALLFLALLSEYRAIPMQGGKTAASITFLPVITSLLLFGLPATILLVAVNELVAEQFIRKKEPIRVAFNVSQWVFSVVVGGFAYSSTGGLPLALVGDLPNMLGQILPFAIFSLLFSATNHAAVIGAIAISRELPLRAVMDVVAGRAGGNLSYDLLISPIALGVAALYLKVGWLGILVSLLPLLFVRGAYLTAQRLQQANSDLLKALVKAIETRDPYTSGHSVRVARLSRSIGERMGLSRRTIEGIENAALLHDVGKIDPVYINILKKPSGLSREERAVIESHVIKGVELLEQLSSLSVDVIADVRHHHERVDGKGYPDGLSGDQIPLGARIIKICDAIDAMLSDRPYRKALTLSEVEEQLNLYAGSQFDSVIVAAVLSCDIIERFLDDAPNPKPLQKRMDPHRIERASAHAVLNS